MVKRILSAVFGVAFTCVFTIYFITAGQGLSPTSHVQTSETFVGAVSSTSYASRAELAEDFVVKELTGFFRDPVYTGYDTVSTLNEEDLSALCVESALLNALVGGQELLVHYTDKGEPGSIKTYALETSTAEFYYYTERPKSGDVLTNTYFASVFDGEKYLNCTATTTLNTKAVSPTTTSANTYTQIISFDDIAAHFDQRIPGYEVDLYIAEKNGSLDVYTRHPDSAKDDGKYYSLQELNQNPYYRYEFYLQRGDEEILLNNFSSLSQITDFIFLMDVDASYFVKTDFGFSMPSENYKEVCRQMMDEDSYKVLEDAWDEYRVSFRADYYVTEGRLSATDTILTMSDGADLFSFSIHVAYTDFGTTVVTLPTQEDA